MRRLLAVVASLGILALVVPATAQQPVGSFTAMNPRAITFTRIDTGQTSGPQNLQSMLRTPSQQQAFNLGNIFRSFSLPLGQPRVANAPMLPAQANRFQPQQNPNLNFFPSSGAYPTKNNPYIVSRPTNLK
jgi:hypothetical protein